MEKEKKGKIEMISTISHMSSLRKERDKQKKVFISRLWSEMCISITQYTYFSSLKYNPCNDLERSYESEWETE